MNKRRTAKPRAQTRTPSGRAATGSSRGQTRQAAARTKVRDIFVVRPFEGLASEPDWVALRELVPAATAPLQLAADLVAQHGERDVTLATLLPMAQPVLVRADGRILLGLQRGTQSGDVSRDLAAALLLALEAQPGAALEVPSPPGPGPRLQDVLADVALDVTLHDGFDFWLDDTPQDATATAALEQANAAIFATEKLAAMPAAYWCRFNTEKAHVRIVLPEQEDTALAALSRLAARRELVLGEETKFAGIFRAHGLRVPVWDLPPTTPASEWDGPVAEFARRYAAARDETGELNSDERRVRHGLLGRQITIR